VQQVGMHATAWEQLQASAVNLGTTVNYDHKKLMRLTKDRALTKRRRRGRR